MIQINTKQHSPKLSDELSEDVLQFGSEVSPHIVFDAPNAFHLNTRVKISVKWGHSRFFIMDSISITSVPTMTVACDASVLGSMMKRMTLMKPKAALTISLVRDDSSRQILWSSCSLVATSMASVKQSAQKLSLPLHKYKHSKTPAGNCWKLAVLPLYSNMSRVSANTVQVIMVTEPVSPAYTNSKYWSMASGSRTDTQLGF